MRRLHAILLGVALATPVLVFAEKPQVVQAQSALTTVSIPVKGMACGSCAARVKKTLSAIDGVKSVEVSQPNGSASVRYVAAKVSGEQLRDAVKRLGFEAGMPVPQK